MSNKAYWKALGLILFLFSPISVYACEVEINGKEYVKGVSDRGIDLDLQGERCKLIPSRFTIEAGPESDCTFTLSRSDYSNNWRLRQVTGSGDFSRSISGENYVYKIKAGRGLKLKKLVFENSSLEICDDVNLSNILR